MVIDWNSAPEGYPLWIVPTRPYEENEAGWHQEDGAVYRDTAGQTWDKENEGTAFTVYRKPVTP